MKFLFTIALFLFSFAAFSQSFNGPIEYMVRAEETVKVSAEAIVTPTSLFVQFDETKTVTFNNVHWTVISNNCYQYTIDDIYYVFNECTGRLTLYGMEDESTADSYRQ